MKKEELLKRCRYIGTGNPFEHYEKMWLDWKLGKEGAISPEFEFYDQFGLKHFNVNDGVPKGIKAYLFTAYVHWNDLNPTIEGFADWYKRQYLKEVPNPLLKHCRYYKGEEINPYPNGNEAMFWEYEEKWLRFNEIKKEFLKNAVDEYIEVGLSNFEIKDDTPLSLKALLFNRYCHWLGGHGIEEDIKNFKAFYLTEYSCKNIAK